MRNQGRQPGSQLRQVATTLVAGGCLALAACSGAHEQAHSATARGIIAPTTDVPALLGTSIDGLRQRLGPPQPLPANFDDPMTANTIASGTPDSATAFRTGGLTLIANYDARTRRVRDLLLLGRHEDSLMGRASLRANAGSYLLMPVFRAGSSNQLLGLRVIAIN